MVNKNLFGHYLFPIQQLKFGGHYKLSCIAIHVLGACWVIDSWVHVGDMLGHIHLHNYKEFPNQVIKY